MERHTVLRIFDTPTARTPKYFGVGVETQLYWKTTNLWDWLQDSGFSFVREFAPDFDMRRKRAKEGDWGNIGSEADFQAWRKQALADPDGDAIHWQNYRFDEEVPWHGTPDGVAEKTRAAGVEPMVSIGYHPRMFPRPLLRSPERDAGGSFDYDWEAAASCYEYAFALVWHFASKFGVSWFMTLNEPENQPDCWYLPDELGFCAEGFGASWSRLFRDDAEPTGLGLLYLASITPQYAALARLVRMAVDDVKALLPERANDFRLIGPSGVVYEKLWSAASEWLDSLDFHHYGEDPARFDSVYPVPAEAARRAGRTVSCSEYNRFSGGMRPDDFAFTMRTGIRTADLVMKSLALSAPGDPEFEFLAFYLFHFPSTHRNYKHLLYGDMNFLDWSGVDFKAWLRPDNWYPQPAECQVRYPTLAYHFVRMLARAARSGEGRPGPFPILRTGRVNPTSAGPDDIHFSVRILAVDQGDRMVLNLLNPESAPADNFRIDPSPFAGRFPCAVVRQTGRKKADAVLSAGRIDCREELALDLPPESLTQLILTAVPLDRIEAIELREESVTPGSLLSGEKQLSLLQTTRLRAIGRCEGEDHDLSELAVIWESSDPHSLPVRSGGLVQRLRDTAGTVRLSASLPGGPSVSIEVAPNARLSSAASKEERRIAGLAEG